MADYVTTFSDGQELEASEMNLIRGARTGAMLPIDDSTSNYSDNAEDLGGSSQRWRDLYLGNSGIIPTANIYNIQPDTTNKILRERIYREASESITAGQAVSMDVNNLQKIVVCDDDDTNEPILFAGVAVSNANTGEYTYIDKDLANLGATSFVEGDLLFLSDTGTFTKTPITDGGTSSGSLNVGKYRPVGYVISADASNTWVAFGINYCVKMEPWNYNAAVSTFTNCSALYRSSNQAILDGTGSSGSAIASIIYSLPLWGKRLFLINSSCYFSLKDEKSAAGLNYGIRVWTDNGSPHTQSITTGDPGGDIEVYKSCDITGTNRYVEDNTSVWGEILIDGWGDNAIINRIATINALWFNCIDVEKLCRIKGI